MFEQLFQALNRQKGIIILAAVFFLALGLVFTFTGEKEGQTTIALLLRFDNVNRGHYPDGSPFNKEDIIAPDIVGEVVRELDLADVGISPRTLRRHLDVVGVMSRATIQEAERLQREGRSPEDIFPSEYRVSLLEGERLGLSEGRQEEILLSVVEVYTDRFRRTHSGLDSPLPTLFLVDGDLQGYDYPLIPDLFLAQADQILDFLDELKSRSRTFRSGELGYSFSDVKRELESLREERIVHLRSLIVDNRLTADPERMIRRYKELIDELETELSLKEQEAWFARDLLKELDLEPTEEGPLSEELADIVEILLRHESHTTLLSRSLEAGLEVEALKVELEYAVARLEQLTGGGEEIELEGVAAAAAAGPANPSPELVEGVDGEIALISERIQGYLDILDIMRRELLEEEAGRAVHILQAPYWETAGRPPAQLLAAWLFLGLMAGGGLAYYRETNQKQSPQTASTRQQQ